jgi:hypothetical protein
MTQPAAPSITVEGNVDGSIVVGDNNFVVNTNHGTIIYKQAAPRVQLRGSAPLPPRKPRGFVGRARELEQLEGWLSAGEPAYISGPDGIGKTTLAKQAANGQTASAAPNGILFVEGIDEAGKLLGLGDLVQRMFDALFESDPPLKVDLTSARTYLSNTRPLVLLSGASLAPEAFNRLPDLFPAAPLLVETAQPPDGDNYRSLALGPLEPDDALALLSDRSGIPPDEKNRPILAEIAGLLGNVPAALATVGNAILNNRLIPEMTARLLREVRPGATQPIQAAMERAYRVTLPALSADERGMLAQVAAAPGLSVERPWMESKFGGLQVANAEVLGLVTANSPRLRLAPGLRQIALEGWNEEQLKQALYERLVALLGDRWLDFGFIRDELGNLLGLLEWASATRRNKIAIYLAQVLDPYLTLSGLWDARQRALDRLMAAARALQDRAGEAWGMHQLGVGHVGAGEVAQARAMFEQARDLRLSLGDREGAAYSQHNLDLLGPPALPHGTQNGGGGLSPLARGILIGGLAVGIIAAGVLGVGAARSFFRPTAAPVPTHHPSATPRATSTPRPTGHTTTPTPTASVTPTVTPDLLGWTITPVFTDLSSQAPTACLLTMVMPRIVGTDETRVLGFNRLIEQFVKIDAARASDELTTRFSGEGCPNSAIGWVDSYRITTWSKDDFLDVEPTEVFAADATFPSSDLLLSVLLLSSYTTPEFTYPPLTFSINYDLNLGKDLALEDLFIPGVPYLEFLSEYAYEDLIRQGLSVDQAKIVSEPRPENYQTWNLTYFGLLVTFNERQNGFLGLEIGTQRVLIPYQELVQMIDPAGPLGAETRR